MTGIRRTLTRAVLVSTMAGSISACWPFGEDAPSDQNQTNFADRYPTVFQSPDPDVFVREFRPELEELRTTDTETYLKVVRGMAQIIQLKDLEVTVRDLAEELPEIDPYDSLPDPSDARFLEMFYQSASDRILQGGVTFESIQKIGAAHEENAGTKYRNALYAYIEQLRKNKESLRERDKKLRELVDMISFIQPTVVSDGPTVRISAPTTNGTEQDLRKMRIVVGEKLPEESWTGPVQLGSAIVTFETPLTAGETRDLTFSVETQDYSDHPITLNVTEVTSVDDFTVRADAMDEPLEMVDRLIEDAQFLRDTVRDDLSRSLEWFPG